MAQTITRFAGLLILSLIGVGCSAGVHPPQQPTDPVPVFVADYGIHSAVMLPVTSHWYVEYAFGDWGYCAANREGIHDALGALMFSGSSAFGKRYIEWKPGESYPKPDPQPHHVLRIEASRANVNRVVHDLEQRWEIGAAKAIAHNPENDTDYVKDTYHYSAVNSCNRLTATTLRELGCKVDGPAYFSQFHLVGTAPPASQQPAIVRAKGHESSASAE